MRKVEDLTSAEKSEIAAIIDQKFKELVCDPRRNALESFLEDVLVHKKELELSDDEMEIQAYDLTYYANLPLSYFRIDPTQEFIPYEFVKTSPEIRLPYYSFTEIAEDVMKETGLDYSYMFYLDNFDPAHVWENAHELEMDFIQSCWKNVQSKHELSCKVFLTANDGTDYYDLDAPEDFDQYKNTESVREYLATKNMHPKVYKSAKRKWWQFLKRD